MNYLPGQVTKVGN